MSTPRLKLIIQNLCFIALFFPFASTDSTQARVAAPDWELTSLTAPVTNIFTPASGALFAAISMSKESSALLWRSDDAGQSWQAVGLPDDARFVTVDPVDHSVALTAGSNVLQRSTDGGTTWQLVRETPKPGLEHVAISPADHNVMYATGYQDSSGFQVYRSQDGGTSWQRVKQLSGDGRCGLVTDVLLLHAVEAERLLHMYHCWGVHGRGDYSEVSSDFGANWTSPPGPGNADRCNCGGYRLPSPETGTYLPRQMVGWSGDTPSRLYLRADVAQLSFDGKPPGGDRMLGSELLRTDDDLAHWTSILSFREESALPFEAEPSPSRRITALAYDPARSDTVFVAINGSVQVSYNAGSTWADLGRQDLPTVKDLGLGIDARNLYAATSAGVYRLSLVPTG